jgi:hypothetical protein
MLSAMLKKVLLFTTLVVFVSYSMILSNSILNTKCFRASDMDENFAEMNITFDYNNKPTKMSYVYSDEEAILSYAGNERVYLPLYEKYEIVKVYSAVYYGEITGKLFVLDRKKYDNTEMVLKTKKGYFYLKLCN